MYTDNVHAYRKAFFTAWAKYRNQQALEPFEKNIVAIIIEHPEYHALLEQTYTEAPSYSLEENPFLHMSLHISLLEQLQLDRPEGIKTLYEQLCASDQDTHEVTHKMMQCLAEILWEAQKSGNMPDENNYLMKLKSLL